MLGQIRHGQKGTIKFFSFNPYLPWDGWKNRPFPPQGQQYEKAAGSLAGTGGLSGVFSGFI